MIIIKYGFCSGPPIPGLPGNCLLPASTSLVDAWGRSHEVLWQRNHYKVTNIKTNTNINVNTNINTNINILININININFNINTNTTINTNITKQNRTPPSSSTTSQTGWLRIRRRRRRPWWSSFAKMSTTNTASTSSASLAVRWMQFLLESLINLWNRKLFMIFFM